MLSGGQVGVFAAGSYNIPLTIAGNGWWDNATTEAGALRLSGGNPTWAGNITLSANARITATSGNTPSITGNILGGSFQLEIGNVGTLTGANTLTLAPSTTTYNQFGTLEISTGDTVIPGNQYAFPTATPAGLTMNGGGLNLNGLSFAFGNLSGPAGTIQNASATLSSVLTVGSDNTSTTYAGTLAIGGAGTLALAKVGTGTLILTGANTYTGGTTISAGALQLGNGVFQGSIVMTGISGSGTLIQAGPSTVTVSAANPFTGTVKVIGGTLVVQPGSMTSAANAVAAGGVLSIQSGSFGSSAAVSVNDGGTLAVTGITSSSSTLTVASLTLGSSTGGTLLFAINGSTSSTTPIITVALPNGLTFNGATGINVTDTGTLAIGEIPLIAYSGATINSGLSISSLPTARTAAHIDYSTPGLIQLNVTGQDSIKWTGNINNIWDVGTSVNTGGTFNWKTNSTSAATNFVSGDAVIFDDTASTGGGTGPVAVTLNVTVTPASVTFNNSSRAYTIGGTGSISGGTSIVISGGGVVTLGTANFYTGGTNLSSGQLNINASGTGFTNSAIGTGLLTIGAGTTISNTSGSPVTLATNNAQTWSGSFTFGGNNPLNMGTGAVTMSSSLTVTANVGASAYPLTIGGVISDGGSGYTLSKAGPGTLMLTAANTFSGGVNVNAGILNVQNSTSLGAATGAVNVAGGGSLQFQGGITVTNPLTISGLGASGQNGALVNVSGTNTFNGGTLTLGANAAISADGGTLSLTSTGSTIGSSANANLILTGAAAGTITGTIDTGTGTVTKNGAGTWTLTGAAASGGASSYSGGTTLNSGTLLIGAYGPLGSGTLTLSGGTLGANGPQVTGGYNTAQAPNAIVVTASTTTALTDGTGADLTLSGPISGSGTLSLNSVISDSIWISGDPTGFTGTLSYLNNNGGMNFRLEGNATNWSNATFVFSGTTTSSRNMSWNVNTGATLQIGALSGVGIIGGATGVGFTLQIGALNTSTTFSGIITAPVAGSGVISLTKVGASALTLSGANTYTGVTTIMGGVLSVSSLAVQGSAGGVATNIGSAGNAAANLVLAGGTLQYTGPTQTTDLLFTLSASSAIDGSGSGGLTFSNPGSIVASSAATLTLTGSNSANVFAPVISDNATGSSNTSIAKAGTGAWILSGANTYSGGTTVSAGTLRAALPTSLGAGSISVNDPGALVIAGLSSSSSTISVPTLTLGSVTGATLGFALNGLPSNPIITVTTSNGLTFNGSTTLNISNSGSLIIGEIPLIAYNGTTISGGFVLGSLPGARQAAVLDYSVPGLIQLQHHRFRRYYLDGDRE